MRLLNKITLELETFLSDSIPPYIILSHRWQGSETNLQEFLVQRHLPRAQQSPGTAKVVRFCAQVANHHEEYVWVDTCCIDKTSSAELQEAINSMYKWYEHAHMCYVLLDDVLLTDVNETYPAAEASVGRDGKKYDSFERSLWFTRGWTLQELLAPTEQFFVDADWKPIGSRKNLSPRIEAITGIRPVCFGSSFEIRNTPVAKRMSWLSGRRTSRAEDLAYCMLGIFDVNITMLYGEGKKAFTRLQREIVQTINDESIFLWRMPGKVAGTTGPILAPSPACFAVCQSLDIKISKFFDREPYQMTTRGLEIELFGKRHEAFTKVLNVVLNVLVDGKRARVPIQRLFDQPDDPNDWTRLLEERVSTLDDHQFSLPPSAWRNFNEEYERLNGFGSSAFADRRYGYRDEITKFKVYIK